MSDSDNWYTPDNHILAAIRSVLGVIDLDPASCAAAQTAVKAKAYYTVETDGLAQAWYGNVYLNPPYSKPLPWVEKLLASVQAGQVKAAILLVNTANTPQWARRLWASSHTVCMLNRRIHFWNPEKPDKESTKQDQMVWYFGHQIDRFAQHFGPLGTIRISYQITDLSGTLCLVCERRFTPKRADALYCGGSCRQKAKRQKAKSVSLAL